MDNLISLQTDNNALSGRLKMYDLEMTEWKMTDKILVISDRNYGVWKMQDWKMTYHANQRVIFSTY